MVKVLQYHKTLPHMPRAILTLLTPLTLGAARRCDDQLCKVSQAIPAQQGTYLALIIISRSYQLQHGPMNLKDCLAVEARHCYIRKTTYEYLTYTHTCMLPSLVPSWQRLLPFRQEICFCRSVFHSNNNDFVLSHFRLYSRPRALYDNLNDAVSPRMDPLQILGLDVISAAAFLALSLLTSDCVTGPRGRCPP